MRPHIASSCAGILALVLAGCGADADKDLLASAQALIAKKDSDGALIQLKNLLQKDANSAEGRYLLGKLLLERGEAAGAAVELQKAVALAVADERPIRELARALLASGKATQVIEQFATRRLAEPAAQADLLASLASAYAIKAAPEKAREAAHLALRSQPRFPPALIVLARLDAAQSNFDGAIELLDTALAQEPGNEAAGLLKGQVLAVGRKDKAAALAAYQAVLASNPKSIGAQVALTTLLFEQGRDSEGRAAFAVLDKLAPKDPETLFIGAQLAFSDKDYKRSRELAQTLLNALPDSPRALELAGASEFRMNHFEAAETLLTRALKGEPTALRPRQMLAQTYLRANLAHKAIDLLQPVLDGKSPDGTTLALAGEAWLQLGEPGKAEAAFKTAAKVAPGDSRGRTQAALSQLARGETQAALAQLEAIVADDRGVRADLALVSARLTQNDRPGALKAIEGLRRKLPDAPLPDKLRGDVLQLNRDLPGATAAYEAALVKDPNYFPAIDNLAALELKAGKADVARNRLEAVIKRDPRNYRAMLALANLTARTGGTSTDVLRLMQDAVKAAPDEPVTHLKLIGQWLSAGDVKAALNAAQAASIALPNDPDIMAALGQALLASGDANQAVRTFRKLASLQPDNAWVQLQLADALAAGQEPAGAARALNRALEINPKLMQAKHGLIALALKERHPQEALALARGMQKSDPKDPAGFIAEGDIEGSRRNWAEAAAAYRAALQRGPTVDTAIKLHGALRNAQRGPAAEQAAAEWLKAHPKDAGFIYYLGDVAVAANDLTTAEAHYRSVLMLQPENALALNNVAWLMIRQGRQGAVPLAEKAVRLLPGRPPLLDTLASALAAANQLPQALEVQGRAVALSPNDPSLKFNLAQLYIKAGDKARARAALLELSQLGSKFADQPKVNQMLGEL